MIDLDTFLAQVLAVISLTAIFGVATYTYLVTRKESKKPTNYKNISLMAQNLKACKPSTRKTVLAELYNNDDWSCEEVDELKSVLEGMLNTKLFINKPGEQTNNGLKAINIK